MTTSAITTLITTTISDYGTALLAILSAVVGIGVAYLVFRFGWRSVKNSNDGGVHHWKWDRVDHHMSNAEMRHRGIRQNAIARFDEGRF